MRVRRRSFRVSYYVIAKMDQRERTILAYSEEDAKNRIHKLYPSQLDMVSAYEID